MLKTKDELVTKCEFETGDIKAKMKEGKLFYFIFFPELGYGSDYVMD